ncbi:hypothetical protein BKG85_11525 [Mycobacteroides chelonae]|nr:hypothetical protein BKG85_11525 [Mycobacteroides chelonae]
MSARETVVQALQEAGVVCWTGIIADEILAALKANRIELVELPGSLPITPEVQSECEHVCLWYGEASHIGAVTAWSDGVVNIDGMDLTVDAANTIASSVLAAAAAADGSTGGEKLGQLDG